MFKKIALPTLALGAALALLPNTAQAREDEEHHHRHRFSVFFGVGPRHYPGGYYDRWGYWHPYRPGFYDARGYWHPYR
jgi:hypothetical protein